MPKDGRELLDRANAKGDASLDTMIDQYRHFVGEFGPELAIDVMMSLLFRMDKGALAALATYALRRLAR